MKTEENNKIELSIIILTYNAKAFTLEAVKSIEENYLKEVLEGKYEVVIADNASTDGSLDFFNEYKKKSKIKNLQIVDNGGNIGFSAGNNIGVNHANGKYLLFLNPDTVVYKKTLNYLVDFMENHPEVGASSCKLISQDGNLDINCHRGLPTPWNAFCYFSGIQRIFPKSRLFSGYTQGWKDLDTAHEVDAIEGAFMLVPRSVGEKIKWWDEDYFFYGEDLQFCYNIKKLGYKIYYVGQVSIMHIGGVTSGIKKKSRNITTANIEAKKMLQKERFKSMKIFYRKNYQNTYPNFLFWIINKGINFLEKRALSEIKVRS
ncbi:glycosyltransferase family 2 protein [Patescibacteria group bacterium]|nr:glycosyltransferase family 2 protein [Patescibacteria group bacterium]